MFITKKALPRRTFLRGVGAAVGLPLLEAMVPALTATAKTAAAPKMRFGGVYIPHGAIMDQYTPKVTGRGFEFTPILKPLEPFRDSLMVISNLDRPGDDDSHATASAAWLSGAIAKKTEGQDFYLGTTIDQVIAKRVGEETPFPSIAVATEDFTGYVGGCSPAYACAYMNTLSWASPTSPVPMEINPRVVFERLFGRPGTKAQRAAQRRQDASVLDSIQSDLTDLQRGLGSRDHERMTEYLENVRGIERRIQQAETSHASDVAAIDAPVGVPQAYADHVSVLNDLLVVAYQADLTRVATFMMAREASMKTYPEIGLSTPHHTMSHHGNKPEVIEQHAKLNTYHLSMFAKFIEKLAATPDGDGSLLDHSLIFYGSGMSNANVHGPYPLPLVAVGGGIGKGRHIMAKEHTPLGNLWVSVAEMFDCPGTAFGTSTGALSL